MKTQLLRSKNAEVQKCRKIFLFCAFALLHFCFTFAQTAGELQTFTDARDGQVYKKVYMPDGRWWMAENLKYRKGLNNSVFAGTPTATINTQMASQARYYCPGKGPMNNSVDDQSDPLACEYWGCLYPWWTAYATDGLGTVNNTVGERGICPIGWHLPSDLEWAVMLDSVERYVKPTLSLASHVTNNVTSTTWAGYQSGVMLKTVARGSFNNNQAYSLLWSTGTKVNYDTLNFSVVPAGYRAIDATYKGCKDEAHFWTSTPYTSSNTTYAVSRKFHYNYLTVYRDASTTNYRSNGYSVRCVEGEYLFKPEISLCSNGSTYEIAVKGFSNYSSFIFNINGVDQAATAESYRFFTSSDVEKIVKVKVLNTEGWSVFSDAVTINDNTNAIPDAPILSINTSPSTVSDEAITTTATAPFGCIVNWMSESGGVISTTNTLKYSGTEYLVYAASVDKTTGCVSFDRSMATVVLYTGTYVQRNLSKGTYQMECWGAAGGYAAVTLDGNPTAYIRGGRGGYSSGNLKLFSNTTIFAYVGGQGGHTANYVTTAGTPGFNGGGAGGQGMYHPTTKHLIGGAGGGGATDIRLKGGLWNDVTGLKRRIIVAGGGGGGGAWDIRGGIGGGLAGGSVTPANGAEIIQGGGQNTGYGFGIGETGSGGHQRSTSAYEGRGGGGGGYYGGRTYWPALTAMTYLDCGGSGGSGFISGHPGCDAVNSAGTHTGQPNHYDGLVFTNTSMVSGVRTGNGGIVIIRTGN